LIEGLGSYSFISPTQTFVANDLVGIGHASGFDLFHGPRDAQLFDWDMLSSIGPLSGEGGPLQWDTSGINTSGGVLVLNDNSTSAIFSAITVPEPSSFAMLALILIPYVLSRKHCTIAV
jgi:hypothetical protein